MEEIKHKVVTRLSKMPRYLNLFILGRFGLLVRDARTRIFMVLDLLFENEYR